MAKLPILTKTFVIEHKEEAWDTIRLRRTLNKLSNYDFTPFVKNKVVLNVYNLEQHVLAHLKSFKFDNDYTFMEYSGFLNPVEASQSFFVLSTDLIIKHYIKIKKIILESLIPLCKNADEKNKVLHCLTDIKSIYIDYQENKNTTI